MLCIAYSENCKLFYVFTVHRPFRPEPPVASEVHATSCTVTYQPPSDDGGAPVTGYVLERCTPGPDSKWITVNHTPVTVLQYIIGNLTPATEYEFRVAAVNKAWTGFFSQMSSKISTAKSDETAVVSPPQVN